MRRIKLGEQNIAFLDEFKMEKVAMLIKNGKTENQSEINIMRFSLSFSPDGRLHFTGLSKKLKLTDVR